MKLELQEIKEQLFDAPSEIKESFNKLVEYFSEHSWSYLMIRYGVPESIRNLQDYIPRGLLTSSGLEKDFHVTLFPGLSPKIDPEHVKGFLKDLTEYKVSIDNISCFECPEYDVVKCDVSSEELFRTNKNLSEIFVNNTIYGDYHPHLTLAYVNKGEGKRIANLLSTKYQEVHGTRKVVLTPTEFTYSRPINGVDEILNWK